MEKNLVYGLFCPYTNKPVYVGQSKVGLDRPFTHVKEKSHSEKVNKWVNNLKSEGKEPVLVVLEYTSDNEYLNDKELFWTNKFLMEGNLLLNQKNVIPEFFDSAEFNTNNCDEDDFLQELRTYVKGRRKHLGLTQMELAQKAGVGLRFVREFEQGKKDNFNTKTLQQLLHLLGNGKLKLTYK